MAIITIIAVIAIIGFIHNNNQKTVLTSDMAVIHLYMAVVPVGDLGRISEEDDQHPRCARSTSG